MSKGRREEASEWNGDRFDGAGPLRGPLGASAPLWFLSDTPPRRSRHRDRRREAADAEHDHDEVPQWSASIQKWEVQAVEPVVQPTVQTREPLFLADNRAARGVDIEPRVCVVGVTHAKDRQRQLTLTVVVIRVVLIEPCDLGDRGTWHRVPCGGDERTAAD